MRAVVGLRVAILVAAATLVVTPPAAAYEQRSGTFSAGLQGNLGSLLKGSREYGAFVWRGNVFKGESVEGPSAGLSIRFRVGLDRESAIGLSFDAMNFGRSLPDGEAADFEPIVTDPVTGDPVVRQADKVHATVVTADYYRYFWRKSKQTPHLVGGLGYYRPEIRFGDFETVFPDAGLALMAGTGGEHFFTRSTSLELSLRYHLLFHDGGPSGAAQVALGLRFYHILRGR
jgi:hypothetical protein